MTTRPGPIYDRVMRRLVESDLAAFCAWIGVPVQGVPEVVPGTFPAETLTTDLLAWTGPGRLLHAEYMRSPTPDVAGRMVGYRAQIMRRHPGARITQVAVVLGQGELRSADDPESGFRLGLHTIYLRDADPVRLLASPDLAPLAVLARGSQAERGSRFAAALDLIRKQPENRHRGLYEAAVTLAAITLDRSIIDGIRKEMGMSIDEVVDFYDGTEIGQVLKERGRTLGREEGLEVGREEGLEVGREAGMAQALLGLLHSRFGDRPDLAELAGRLARSGPVDVVIAAINSAAEPDDIEPSLKP